MMPVPQQPILVLSSPSGGGKTTLRNKLLNEPGSNREFMVSYTTRMPRTDEVDGVDYHFIILRYLTAKDVAAYKQNTLDAAILQKAQAAATREFEGMIQDKTILFEDTHFYGNRYGTPREQLRNALAAGKQVIVDVNREGLTKFNAAFANHVRSIFLMPPSLETLARRLEARIERTDAMTESLHAYLTAQNALRMAQAATTMGEATDYDHVISTAGTPQQTFDAVKQAIAQPLQPQQCIDLSSLSRFHTPPMKGRAA